jgi:hypothetical protein
LSALDEERVSLPGRQYVEQRYQSAIRYYWRVGARNKRAYKWSRYLTIVLGAAVTLFASLSAAQLPDAYGRAVTVATPLLAALSAIIGGFSQSFQWGASWREMVLTAERLEAERDRLAVTPDDELDLRREVALVNQLVQRESSQFFDRVMGSSLSGAIGQPPSGPRAAAGTSTQPD